VLGFADSVGSPEHNLAVSQGRAEAVKDALKADGIDAQFEGFGSAMPLAVDKGPDGKGIAAAQKKNRRVELWAKV
jgi:outer membrane protein OmpA-like peptidoglycan-associated protein